MRKALIVILLAFAAGAGFMLYNRTDSRAAQSAGGTGARPSGGGPGMGGAGAFARPPLTVEVAKAARATIAEQILVVGNLIGAATVEVVPKVSGRLRSVAVRLGDPVRQGQVIALVEDQEIQEQVKQAEASFEVARATVRQREADLTLARSNLERSRSLFNRQLLPQQTLDDTEARYQAAAAQLDLARAQFEQARARLEELRITLANTRIVSPVDGFVGRRHLDPGAFVGPNSPVASVVDIRTVRLVVNLVEKDLRRVEAGTPAVTEVDAYPGEQFIGRVARVAPVLDPATRTAEIEVEIPNPAFRLKPGMYARSRLTIGRRENALVVPRNAVVDVEGRRGVFVFDAAARQARFRPVDVGLQDDRQAEILGGLDDGQTVITTGAAALRDGDPVLLPGMGGPGGPGGRPGGAGRPAAGRPAGAGSESPGAGAAPGQGPRAR